MNGNAESWITRGHGITPSLRWSFLAEAPLICLDHARETGDIFVADASGSAYRLNRTGRLETLTRSLREIRGMAWCDTADAGAALIGPTCLARVNAQFETEWSIDFPCATTAVGIAPFGEIIAVSLDDGTTLLYNSEKKRIARFETMRPLCFLEFLATEASLVAAAETGLLCSRRIDGRKKFDEKLWSNVGDMSAAGDGSIIALAAFNHGVQTYKGDGTNLASYVFEGTVGRVSISFRGERTIAATLERHLYWIDSDGEMLWAATTPDDVCQVICDPLGEWLLCGLADGHVLRLDWDSASKER